MQVCSIMRFFLILQNGMYKPVVNKRVIDVRPKHQCSTRKFTQLYCIDEHGMLLLSICIV